MKWIKQALTKAKIVIVFIIIYYRLRSDFFVFQTTENSQKIGTWDLILRKLRHAIQKQLAGYRENIEELIGPFVNKLSNKSSVTFPFFPQKRSYYASAAREAPRGGSASRAGNSAVQWATDLA
ncbi:hypothetical protein MPTK1_6g19340 [Marchantia polymorpha subsp. ruderalis]|uniref:Uncharacterized protein n=1 Tax=Marchantia polymorpha TaxID=3197 RepID=A0A2R6X053_MARPO|nr:hypothetical protein MARPO_0045s0129 [Marchantia polymorpha]|eukprot:PTQ39485.1 hypothetical protein MARPO_0045s0129 [Marchantia polymorpha]